MSRLYLTDQKDEKIHLKFLILASMIETRPEMIGIPPPPLSHHQVFARFVDYDSLCKKLKHCYQPILP